MRAPQQHLLRRVLSLQRPQQQHQPLNCSHAAATTNVATSAPPHRSYAAVALPNARRAANGAPPQHVDVLVVGAGHNGLVAAYLLAKQGLAVRVVERADVAGGACRTEHPFKRVPGLGQSTGAYLLGVMPPELYRLLNLSEAGVQPLRRDPHYFLPTPREQSAGARSLLLGSDADSNKRQFERMFSPQDWKAETAMQAELALLREDLGHSWLRPPPPLPSSASAEDVARAAAERYVRPSLRDSFVSLMTKPALHWLEERFGFRNPLLKAMYVVTDGLSGLAGGVDDASTGPNFLVHNMCRLPGSGGTWMVVKGGMGSVTQALTRRAAEAGARVTTGDPVATIDFDRPAAAAAAAAAGGVEDKGRGAGKDDSSSKKATNKARIGSASPIRSSSGTSPIVTGVTLASGEQVRARAVLVNADPFTLRSLASGGKARFSSRFNARLDSLERDGFTCKVNLALRKLPTFKCLLQDHGQHRTTAHLLPGVGDGGDDSGVLQALREGHSAAQQGQVLPSKTAIEVYFHSTVDRSLATRAPAGYHSAALFVQHIPYKRADGKAWDERTEADLARGLLEACDEFADFSACVADTMTLSPRGVEKHFGIHRGHIHHVDNGFFFSQRFPYKVPGVEGLFCASAGTHPAGSVIGCGGHNAAGVVARALDLEPWWSTAAAAEDGDGTCGW
jgi:phytoene dehydrogenase-like protein